MTPEPMSYADIEAIRDEFSTLTGDYFKSNSPEFAEYTRAIIAARDAQWREMLGEPVAWRVRRHDAPNYWIVFLHKPVDALEDPEREVQPLYAIKDKP